VQPTLVEKKNATRLLNTPTLILAVVLVLVAVLTWIDPGPH
jgi:hypothetical protein